MKQWLQTHLFHCSKMPWAAGALSQRTKTLLLFREAGEGAPRSWLQETVTES